MISCLFILVGCGEKNQNIVQGYVEGDFLRISLPESGIVTSMTVMRGQIVKAGDALFSLDNQSEAAAVEKAAALLKQFEAQQLNLLNSEKGKEINALKAELLQFEADLQFSQNQYKRHAALVKIGAISALEFDKTSNELHVNKARVIAATHRLAKAKEGIGRKEEVHAAIAAAQAQQAALNEAKSLLQKRLAFAPSSGRIEDVYYRRGETVAAGQPVLSLLPPENIRIRFFLNPQQIGRIKQDMTIRVSCFGCANNIRAKINYIAKEASYKPPILYSRDHSEKLVFLVEARPVSNLSSFHPGQPVTINLLSDRL